MTCCRSGEGVGRPPPRLRHQVPGVPRHLHPRQEAGGGGGVGSRLDVGRAGVWARQSGHLRAAAVQLLGTLPQLPRARAQHREAPQAAVPGQQVAQSGRVPGHQELSRQAAQQSGVDSAQMTLADELIQCRVYH